METGVYACVYVCVAVAMVVTHLRVGDGSKEILGLVERPHGRTARDETALLDDL